MTTIKAILNKFDGWWHGLLMACLAFPMYNVGAKFSIDNYNVNPLIYLCFGSLFASLFLLIYSGKGRLTLESLRTVDTWLFSFLNLAALSFGTFLFSYVSALQGAVLLRSTSIVCFIIVLIMGQSSKKREFLLTMVAFLAISVLFYNIQIESRDKAILLILLIGGAICQALKQILSEFHKTNIQAKTHKEHAMVAGIVSAVSAVMYLTILLFLSMYQTFFDISFFNGIPDLKEFFSLPAILCSFIFSGTMIALAVYGEIYASKKISAKYLSVMIALGPFFVIIYDSIISILKNAPLPFSNIDLSCTLIMTLANLSIAIFAIRNKSQSRETELRAKYLTASQENVRLSSELTKSTMSFVHNDIDKTSQILKTNKNIIIDLLALEDDEHYKLSELTFDNLNKNYYLNVSTKDSLTNITNRGNLEQQILNLLYQKTAFNLAFIDLNKFKAINDTIGHDAGDEVLKFVANQMQTANPDGINARNGGDEFIMIIFSKPKTKIKKFKSLIMQGVNFNQTHIEVSASVGLSNSKQANDLDSLIKIADKNMYLEKQVYTHEK